jgi:hypothetical protein
MWEDRKKEIGKHTVGTRILSRTAIHVDGHVDALSIKSGGDGHRNVEGSSSGIVGDDAGQGTGAGDVVQDDWCRRSLCEDQTRTNNGGEEEEVRGFHFGMKLMGMMLIENGCEGSRIRELLVVEWQLGDDGERRSGFGEREVRTTTKAEALLSSESVQGRRDLGGGSDCGSRRVRRKQPSWQGDGGAGWRGDVLLGTRKKEQ